MLNKEKLVGVGLITLLHLCFFSVCVAGQNQPCRPSSCGDMLNISDPFRLKGDPSGCGDSRYELACENNRTILNLYRGKYYVEEINYQNYSIRVVDPGLKKGNCLSTPLYHLTPENFSYDHPYAWPYDWGFRTTVLMSCSRPISDDKFIPITSCNSTNGTTSSSSQPYHYALSGDGESLQVGDLPGSCTIGKSIFSKLGAASEPGNRSMSSLQDQLLLGIELSFLQIQCIRECRVKGQSCYMDYTVNSVKCDDPNSCKDLSDDCYKPIWLKGLIIILQIIFASIYTPIIAAGILGRALLGVVLSYGIYKLRQRHISKHDTTKEIP